MGCGNAGLSSLLAFPQAERKYYHRARNQRKTQIVESARIRTGYFLHFPKDGWSEKAAQIALDTDDHFFGPECAANAYNWFLIGDALRMKMQFEQAKTAYEKPRIEVLGNFAALTLGGKTSGVSDMHSGFSHGPGS